MVKADLEVFQKFIRFCKSRHPKVGSFSKLSAAGARKARDNQICSDEFLPGKGGRRQGRVVLLGGAFQLLEQQRERAGVHLCRFHNFKCAGEPD